MKKVTRFVHGILLMTLMLISTGLWAGPAAQVLVTLGTGTSTTTSYPYNTYWMDGRTQILYKASEIIAAGGMSGSITTFGLNVSGLSGQTMNGFNLRMAHTTATSLSTPFVTMPWTTCLSTNLNVTATGWQNLALTTPFAWNGVDNIIVEICWDNTYYTTYIPVYISTTSYTSVVYRYTDGETGCTMAASYTTTGRPNTQMTFATGTLQGTVRNSFNNAVIPFPNIAIGTSNWTGLANGTYSFNYGAGTYQVTASATGFLPKTKTGIIVTDQTTTLDFLLDPIPATVTGVVTNAATGAPVVGAKVVMGTNVTYSTGPNGAYTLNIYPAATGTITISKDGFDDFIIPSATYTPPTAYTQNVALTEKANPPVNVVATLNAAQTGVDITWGLPVGDYQLIYDDGKAENFAIWASGGNMHAVKFTPLAYPVTLFKAKINIGTVDNYPVGANPLKPFQVAVYDASGPGGLPGAEIVPAFSFTPLSYGWNDIPIPATTISSGNFYIVMIQGGAPPDAAGVAVDTTTQQLRSYAKFGSGPWIPASGNFLIRAAVSGTGGPLMNASQPAGQEITATVPDGLIYTYKMGTYTGTEGVAQIVAEGDGPESITGYQVWRLKQGEETNPAVWTTIGTPTTLNITDPSWPSLACGPYLWAVKAQYTFNRWSNAAFSNVIGKCWTAVVTVNVDLSCDSLAPEYATVKLQNLVYPDTVYTAMTGPTGTVVFDHVWKGNYTLTVDKFGFSLFTQTPVTIMGDMTFNPVLLQIKTPPTGMHVNDRTLWSGWKPPVYVVPIFTEAWASGNFTANGWVADASSNWSVTTGAGNPAPSAMFNWSPEVLGYSQSLTSKTFTANSPAMKVQYDIYLSNFGTSTLEQMAVEFWDGTAWHTIKNYENNANIPWTTDVADAAPYYTPGAPFKIRFRAYGEDSYNINNWNIDNIKLLASSGDEDPCLIGYNLYLNNVQIAFVPAPDTNYRIPPSTVKYGTTYNACVLAVYGSGYSTTSCAVFTSHFLYPPKNIQGTPIDDAAYITWEKPVISDDAPAYAPVVASASGPANDVSPVMGIGTSAVTVPMSNSDAIYSNGTIINSPGTGAGGADESIIEGGNYGTSVNSGGGYSQADDFVVPAGGWNISKFNLYTYQTNAPTSGSITGAFIRIWNGAPNAGGTIAWGDMTTNRMSSQTFSNIYRVTAPAGGTARAVMNIECNVSGLSLAPGTYWLEFGFTGSASYTGPWAPYLVGTTPTPANALLNTSGTWSALVDADGITARGVPFLITHDGSGGGGTPDGLIGYNIYRDDAFHYFVNSPDTLYYYDYHLDPGTYCYDVSAKYDLTTYGFPGQFDESLVADNGPVCVNINYGRLIPFFEPWESGNFTFNDWTTTGGNWDVNTGLGNPAPSVDFNWQPIVSNYEQSIETPTLSAGAWTCAKLWLDFDVKLLDRNANGTESLFVELYSNGSWTEKAEITNEGDIPWTGYHIDIKSMQGKAFKIRFRAAGESSDNILHWYVDNIHVYGICNSPTLEVSGVTQSQFTTKLDWEAPDCPHNTLMHFIFDDGTWENGWCWNAGVTGWFGTYFPIDAAMSGVLTEFQVYFVDNGTGSAQNMSVDVFDGTQTLVGSTAQFSANVVDTWITVPVPNVPFSGPFYGMVKWENTTAQSYFLADDEDGPYSSQNLGYQYDGTTFTASSPSCVYFVRATALVNGDLKTFQYSSTPMPAGIPNSPVNASSVGRSGDSGNHDVTGIISAPDSSSMTGYNIYRTDETGTGPFTRLNSGVLTSPTFTDTYPTTLETGDFLYYVEALFEDSMGQYPSPMCTSNSDTILVHFPAQGINDLSNSGIRMFPNPATTYVNVDATSSIVAVEVLNFLGQTIYTQKNVNKTKLTLDVSNYESGVYFVKVTTTTGTKSSKITVTR